MPSTPPRLKNCAKLWYCHNRGRIEVVHHATTRELPVHFTAAASLDKLWLAEGFRIKLRRFFRQYQKGNLDWSWHVIWEICVCKAVYSTLVCKMLLKDEDWKWRTGNACANTNRLHKSVALCYSEREGFESFKCSLFKQVTRVTWHSVTEHTQPYWHNYSRTSLLISFVRHLLMYIHASWKVAQGYAEEFTHGTIFGTVSKQNYTSPHYSELEILESFK